MIGMISAILIGFVLPIGIFFYAIVKKQSAPYLLGVLAFFVSQMILRIPLLDYFSSKSVSFQMLSVTKPIIYVIIIGFSAGIFEEVARFLAMTFFMKQRKFESGVLFGVGHGGIEAILFLGVHAIMMMFSPTTLLSNEALLLGSVERLFAILLHIGLSIIVLYGVVMKRIRYLIMAITIHGVMDTMIGLVPMFVPEEFIILIIEGLLVLLSMSVLVYSVRLNKRGDL